MGVLKFSYWRMNETLRTLEFPSTADFVKEIDTNDDIDTALPLDAPVSDVTIGNTSVDERNVKVLNDLYIFCKGNVFGQNEVASIPQPVEKGSHVCIEEVFCTIGDKAYLINHIPDMGIGDMLDFHDMDFLDKTDAEHCSFGTCYCIEKIRWKDSIILLIGGYGGETLSAYLDSETLLESPDSDIEAIKLVVTDFFNLRNIKDDELIAIENLK